MNTNLNILTEQIKNFADVDELKMLAVCRSVNLQIDESVYTCLTRQETELLKIAQAQSKYRYRIKREMTGLGSHDPLIALRSHIPLASTSRKHINPLATIATKLPTAPVSTSHLQTALLAQSTGT